MALIHSFEADGNWLFRYRSYVPLGLFVLAIPAVYFTDYDSMSEEFIIAVGRIAMLISLIGFLIRVYTIGTTPFGTSGRNTDKQVAEQLNTSGIYSVVRHPLYLGNYLIWLGIILFTKNFYFVIIASLLYWIYYERIMFAEERFLERKFGDAYLQWSLKAPAFIPRLKQFRKSDVPFSLKSVLRREYSGVLATVIGYVYVELLISWFRWHLFSVGHRMIYVLVASVIITIVLRSVKHYTGLLKEEGRS